MPSYSPLFFGPQCWRLIHAVAFTYPIKPTPTDMNNYKQFYESLAHVLPCKDCRDHYAKLLQVMPLDGTILSNRELLIKWTYDIHTAVNKRKMKLGANPSYAEFYRFYSSNLNH